MEGPSEVKHISDNDESSDEESLAMIKKRQLNTKIAEKSENSEELSEDEDFIPGIYVEVKLNEGNDNEGNDPGTIKKKKKKKKKGEIRKRIAKDPRKKYKCRECSIWFMTFEERMQHSVQHQVETRHKCDECGRCFTKAFGLRTHKRTHGEKSIKCPLCDATFRLKFNLGRHMMYHDKAEKCTECSASFYTKPELMRHQCGVPSDPLQFVNTSSEDFNESELNLTMAKETDQLGNVKSECVTDNSETDEQPNSELNQEYDNHPDQIVQQNNYENPTAAPSNFENKTEQPYNENQPNYDTQDDRVVDLNKPAGSPVYRRSDLDLQTQCAIVAKMSKGRSVADICHIYNIVPELVNEIWERREDIGTVKKPAGRTGFRYMNSILDSKILEWFNQRKNNNMQINGRMVMDYAEALAKELGFVAFNGSKKWLDRFKARYKLNFRDVPPKRDYTKQSESKWKKIFLSEQWLDARMGFSNEDIYIGDEIGFYINSSATRVKKMASKKYVHGNAKDRLVIFVCTNVSGSDKKKLLVCGALDPLVRTHRRPETLPCTYIRHPDSHFTTPMFEEYVKMWNKHLQMNNKKALLILDRATIHSKLTLSHLKLVFVPWKAASTLTPTKNGIFNRFKHEYTKLVFEFKSANCLKGIDRNIDLIEALFMLDKAWRRTPGDVICKSFLDVGYDIDPEEHENGVPTPALTEKDEELMSDYLSVFNIDEQYKDTTTFDNYILVDEDLLTGQGTNCSVFGGNHKCLDAEAQQRELEEILPIGTERPESNEVERKVLSRRALNDLEIVRKYLQASDTSFEVYSNFFDIERFLLNQAIVG